VRDAVDAGERIVVVGIRGDKQTGLEVSRLTQDVHGRDIASGVVEGLPRAGFTLGTGDPAFGTPVWSFGYPLTDPPTEHRPTWHLNGRYLQGYVTRTMVYNEPSFGDTRTIELDMRAPAGLSGAPLLRAGTRELIGMIYGVAAAEQLEEFGRYDPVTGTRHPELVRLEHFALAHHTTSLREHRSEATEGKALAEVMGEWTGGPEFRPPPAFRHP
jgi:hypothetical protein